jgi:molybdopterin-guanine dinucleotide biosynthesis protein A
MGRDKASLPFPTPADPPLIARVHAILCPITAPCLIAGPSSFGLGCLVVDDYATVPGPVGGLIAGLEASTEDLVLVCAADVPFPVLRLAEELIWRAREKQGAAAVVCLRDGLPEPLFAVYRKSASESLRQMAKRTGPKHGPALRSVVAALGPVLVEEDEWRPLDPEASSFQSCNTQEELAQAAARATLEKTSGGTP